MPAFGTGYINNTFVVVPPVAAVLLHADLASVAEPVGVAEALPLHQVVRLALAVAVAVAGTAAQAAVLAVPA